MYFGIENILFLLNISSIIYIYYYYMFELEKMDWILRYIKENISYKSFLTSSNLSKDEVKIFLEKKRFIFKEWMSYFEIKKWNTLNIDIEEIIQLRRYNIISDSSFFINEKLSKDIYFDFQLMFKNIFFIIDLEKMNFTLDYIYGYIKLKNINQIENIIDKIKIVWFEKIYREFNISDKYKIKDPILFVYYIYFLNKNELIKKLNLILRDKFKKVNIWIVFDYNNWKVFNNWILLWIIKFKTCEFKLFEYLYKNKWKHILYQELSEKILKWESISKTKESYFSDIKRRLPKNIKCLIKAPKWWYIIP